MRTKVINADTIDQAVDGILGELLGSENVIYFDGWDGLGASAVLQAVAERLAISKETETSLEFEKIIHIDCSKWESRRAMQRKIAEQLNLPNVVMEILDKQDEEDDFSRLAPDSRCEIAQVVRETYQTVQNSRCLVILHNGSNEEIDIFNFGLSLYTYPNSKMIWTFQGRFRLDPKMIDIARKSTKTNLLLSASGHKRDPHELLLYLLHREAAQVVCNKKNGHGIIDPAIAAECVLYMLKQRSICSHIIEYDWGIHTCNYWLCDGIIIPQRVEAEIDKAWQLGDALQHEIRLDTDRTKESTLQSHLVRLFTERTPYWISTATCGFVLSPSGVIPGNMFQHSDRLGVLKLSRCSFSFSSPPFLCCSILRFLWLDHCQDLRSTDAEKREEEEDTTRSWACFQSLWVLDLRYTDWDLILSAQVMDLMTELRELNVMGAKNWDMSHLRGRLRNIRKLRVTKSTCCFDNNVFSEMESMELLDFSGNNVVSEMKTMELFDFSRNHITQRMASLSGLAGSGSLETVIIDGCDGLRTISLRGCTQLKNLVVKGLLPDLEELDLSGTRVKTLNLGEMEASYLSRLILLGCEKLVAIKGPSKTSSTSGIKWKISTSGLKTRANQYVLRIDTTSTSASADGSEVPHSHPPSDRFLQQQKEEKFNDWQISLTDARFLRSISLLLEVEFEQFQQDARLRYIREDAMFRRPLRADLTYASLHIDIYHAATLGDSNVQRTSIDKLVVGSKYMDVLNDGPIAAMTMWDCPGIPVPYDWTCIIKVITQGQSASTSALLLPPKICDWTTSLHVYDNPSITSIPAPSGGSTWKDLRWCRVERCPRLHTLFPTPHGNMKKARMQLPFSTLTTDTVYSFYNLETFWGSQLLTARYIWDDVSEYSNCGTLTFLHLDCCPRLIHVLPMRCVFNYNCLVTLEIVCCGDLREVFSEHQNQDTVKELKCPKLMHIHLYELPMLQHICRRRISAPKLKTIKIRGCWSLRSLPAIGRDTKPPMVDCEKEWWEHLEWDGVEVYHHPSLYQPSHSSHYKKAQLPRGTLLR